MATIFKNKMKILILLIIIFFITFCLYSIFEFDNLDFSSTREIQEEIVITIVNNDTDITDTDTDTATDTDTQYITTNTTNDVSISINNDLELKPNITTQSPDTSTTQSPNTSTTTWINPLSLPYCQNAILNNDQFNITETIYQAANDCNNFNGVYTREGLDAYMNGTCPYDRQSVRTHELVMKYIKSNGNLHD
eukprot:999961_1